MLEINIDFILIYNIMTEKMLMTTLPLIGYKPPIVNSDANDTTMPILLQMQRTRHLFLYYINIAWKMMLNY